LWTAGIDDLVSLFSLKRKEDLTSLTNDLWRVIERRKETVVKAMRNEVETSPEKTVTPDPETEGLVRLLKEVKDSKSASVSTREGSRGKAGEKKNRLVSLIAETLQDPPISVSQVQYYRICIEATLSFAHFAFVLPACGPHCPCTQDYANRLSGRVGGSTKAHRCLEWVVESVDDTNDPSPLLQWSPYFRSHIVGLAYAWDSHLNYIECQHKHKYHVRSESGEDFCFNHHEDHVIKSGEKIVRIINAKKCKRGSIVSLKVVIDESIIHREKELIDLIKANTNFPEGQTFVADCYGKDESPRGSKQAITYLLSPHSLSYEHALVCEHGKATLKALMEDKIQFGR
jgi:hypothetical protein